MKWVTWSGVGVDRMACAWLIRTQIDPDAQFLFVPEASAEVPADAEPFDLPGRRFSHHDGHCSFYALVQAYALRDPILARIARIVDEADTVAEVELEPAAPGLDLLCRGLRRISSDDHIALERGALLYEALYAQLASEEPLNATPGVRPSGTSEQSTNPPLSPRLWPDPHGERDHAVPDPDHDHDAFARWEGEGGTPPLDHQLDQTRAAEEG
jgi:hypothetical protein